MRERTDLVIFKAENSDVSIQVDFKGSTVWATQPQIAELFNIDRTTVLRHIKNILKDKEIDAESNVHKMHIADSDKPVLFYSLDVILSVGYRTNSGKAIAFRRWANRVLKQYLLQGCAINHSRLGQLNKVIEIISRSAVPEIAGVASVLEQFTAGVDILDGHDHETLKKPKFRPSEQEKFWQLTYEEGREVIESMKFGDTSVLFGHEIIQVGDRRHLPDVRWP